MRTWTFPVTAINVPDNASFQYLLADNYMVLRIQLAYLATVLNWKLVDQTDLAQYIHSSLKIDVWHGQCRHGLPHPLLAIVVTMIPIFADD